MKIVDNSLNIRTYCTLSTLTKMQSGIPKRWVYVDIVSRHGNDSVGDWAITCTPEFLIHFQTLYKTGKAVHGVGLASWANKLTHHPNNWRFCVRYHVFLHDLLQIIQQTMPTGGENLVSRTRWIFFPPEYLTKQVEYTYPPSGIHNTCSLQKRS